MPMSPIIASKHEGDPCSQEHGCMGAYPVLKAERDRRERQPRLGTDYSTSIEEAVNGFLGVTNGRGRARAARLFHDARWNVASARQFG
jgi:hypothetical protein